MTPKDQIQIERAIMGILKVIGKWQLRFLLKSFFSLMKYFLGSSIGNLMKLPSEADARSAEDDVKYLSTQLANKELMQRIVKHSDQIIEVLVKPIFAKLSEQVANGSLVISETASQFIFKVGSKIMTAGVRATVNAAQAIPIIGIFISLARILTNFTVVSVEVVLQTLYSFARIYYFLLSAVSPDSGSTGMAREMVQMLSQMTGDPKTFVAEKRDVYVEKGAPAPVKSEEVPGGSGLFSKIKDFMGKGKSKDEKIKEEEERLRRLEKEDPQDLEALKEARDRIAALSDKSLSVPGAVSFSAAAAPVAAAMGPIGAAGAAAAGAMGAAGALGAYVGRKKTVAMKPDMGNQVKATLAATQKSMYPRVQSEGLGVTTQTDEQMERKSGEFAQEQRQAQQMRMQRVQAFKASEDQQRAEMARMAIQARPTISGQESVKYARVQGRVVQMPQQQPQMVAPAPSGALKSTLERTNQTLDKVNSTMQEMKSQPSASAGTGREGSHNIYIGTPSGAAVPAAGPMMGQVPQHLNG